MLRRRKLWNCKSREVGWVLGFQGERKNLELHVKRSRFGPLIPTDDLEGEFGIDVKRMRFGALIPTSGKEKG